MATNSREEQTNWYRVCRLLTEGGKMILIDFLKQSIGSYTLDSYLASKRNDVNKVKQLHQPQKDILYLPGGGNTDPRQWDITLTSCIINKLIKPADPLQKSSIDDIRQLRNEIFGHCGELRMNQSEFQTNWSRIKQIFSKASVVLLHNAGSFSLTSLEEDIENDEVTNLALNQMKHILDNWMQCDIVGGLSEVKSCIERQTEGHSEVKSIVEGVKSAVEKQTEGHSEVKGVVEGVKSAVEKQTEGHSEVKSVVEGVKSAVEKQIEGYSEVKSVVEGVKSAVEKQTEGHSGVKSVVEGVKGAIERQTEGHSEVKSVVEGVKSAVEKQIEGHSEVKSVVEGVKSAVEKQIEGHSEVKSVVEGVKSAVEKQIEGHSEVKSVVEGVKSAVEKQIEGHSEVKSVVEGVKGAIERQFEGHSQVKSVVEGVKVAVEKQTEGHSEVKSIVEGVKSAVEKQIEGHSGVKSVVEGVKVAIERQIEGHSRVKSVVEGVQSVIETQIERNSEVKNVIEGVKSDVKRQTEGQSELKCVMERQSAELSGLKSAVEGLKDTIAREDRACSEIKDSSCPIHEGQGPASMQSQSPNDQGVTAENIPSNSITTGEGLQTRTCLPPELEGLQSHLIAYYKKYVIKSPTAVNTARGQTDIDNIYVEPDLVLVDHTALTQETAKEEDISIEHIFHNDTNKCRLIYLNGDAGMGKTSFTKYLVSEWCKSHSHDKNTCDVKTLSSMKRFDFLFHVPLRNAKGTYKVSEMIVAQLLEGYSCTGPCCKKMTNPQLFLDELLKHWSDRCLIILDGLDEWKAPEQSSCHAVSDGIPGRSPHLKYTILTTSRPWKMEQLRLGESEIDRQLKLKGVQSVSGFAGKMISYFNERLQKYKQYAYFKRVLAEENLEKMTETPILLKQLICMWFHEQSFGKSKTEIYTNMVDLLLQLAEQREKVKQLNTNDRRSSENVPTPSCFRKGGKCEKYKSLLLSLGRLAFETQFGGEEESRLVFETDETEAYGMSEEEIDVCLFAGILTQDIVPEPVRDLKSMSFIHKTFHEYFTALYLSAYGENLNDIDTRFSYKSLNLDSMLDMEDTFIFLGGMCPLFLKDIVSKYLVEIVDKDEKVVRCRYAYQDSDLSTLRPFLLGSLFDMRNLYRVQLMLLACCKECSRNGHSPLYLPVPDYINYHQLQNVRQEEHNILDLCLRHYPLQLKSFNFEERRELFVSDDSPGIKQHLDIKPYNNLCRLVLLMHKQTYINLAVSMPKLEYIHFCKVSSLQLLSLIQSARNLKVLYLISTMCNDPSTGIQSSCDLDLSKHSELIHLNLEDMSLETLAVNSSLIKLCIINVCLPRHDTMRNLVTQISCTITRVHLESVKCREHDKAMDCGYSIELSECRELEMLYLKNISPESVTLSPPITSLTLNNIHTFKHDALCSLMASISNTRSITKVHLESVRCREHAVGDTCGYTIDLSGHDRLKLLVLKDLSPASVRICEVEGKIELSDIHSLQHKELSELLTLARKVEIHHISKSTCAEHGMSIDCMLNLGLEDIIDEVISDEDDEDLDDELFSDPDDADLNLQLHLHHLYSGAVSINKTDAENQNVVESGDLNSHAENLISNTDTATDADDNGDSNLEQEGTDELLEDTGDVNLQH